MPPLTDVVVLGTRNKKKGGELVELLAPWRISVLTLADFPTAIEVEEDGVTFGENARKKACEQSRHLGQWVLGEDSGLVVEALGGAPGVYSARYSGPNATDESNNQRLLEQMKPHPWDQRGAHYVCHAVLSNPEGGVVAEVERCCQGRIRFEPVGNGGFGYDPLFEIVEYHRTFGEMSPVLKQMISHRGRAMRALTRQWIRSLATDCV